MLGSATRPPDSTTRAARCPHSGHQQPHRRRARRETLKFCDSFSDYDVRAVLMSAAWTPPPARPLSSPRRRPLGQPDPPLGFPPKRTPQVSRHSHVSDVEETTQRPGPSWSTPECRPVAPHPRAVRSPTASSAMSPTSMRAPPARVRRRYLELRLTRGPRRPARHRVRASMRLASAPSAQFTMT